MNEFIQICIGVIVVGSFYSLWSSSKIYGGIIGTAVRLFGIGMLFFIMAVFERLLVSFSIIQPSVNLDLTQQLFDLAGLIFLGWGFLKLASANKA
jgi:multisubunit Na+/H+ antiporter MnhC subunit